MHCHHFQSDRCHSCRWLADPSSDTYTAQLTHKQHLCQETLAEHSDLIWLPAQTSPEQGFRNKAKMVVSGTWQSPMLGILSPEGQGIDLTDCPLYPTEFMNIFQSIKHWIQYCQLTPYSVTERSGELKFVLVSYSHSTQQWMIRWVLRSQALVNIMKQHLPTLLNMLTPNSVVSVNIQPIDMAVLEGETELILTTQSEICFILNDIPLYCRPKSFFQTNDVVAEKLYRQVQEFAAELNPSHLWDLFCGVGGFALHLAQALPQTQVTGIEVSAEAIASATLSATQLAVTDHTHFQAITALDFSKQQDHLQPPDGVIVNPPRRGLGADLCHQLNHSDQLNWIIYSSCHLASLSQDLTRLTAFKPIKAQVFDMFPYTDHAEILTLLVRIH